MNIIQILAKELGVKESQVEASIKLIDEGNTIPFIARYRKEVTGSLNDEILRTLDERLRYLRNLEERQEAVIRLIAEQDKLTKELEEAILSATTLVAVEDLYRPYKKKKRTRATIAKERGLEPLAKDILAGEIHSDIYEFAKKYINEENEILSAQDAILGASDIIAEIVSDEAQYRQRIRKDTFEEGLISSSAKEEVESVYENYYAYEENIKKIVPHRILAINRGENEKILNVKILAPKEKILEYLYRQVIKKENAFTNEVLKNAVDDAYDRLIAPAIERDIRSELTEKAEDAAIEVFSKNLEQLLMQAPIKGKTVMGWDPAFRTGCKLAIVDSTGKVLDTKVIYPTAPQKKEEESKRILKELIQKYKVNLISLGNGTASRESELVIASLLKEMKEDVHYIIVNEAGASVYSASKLGAEEFPSFDVGQRSAASIARRLQDPLAELVKIEPKAIGVGQYQHDMNQKNLEESLLGVVEKVVNNVGVDLNTASASLLSYISGINKTIAKNIITYREEKGFFASREELLKVPKLGPKAFEQCAGFLRIRNGKEALDATGVHPESYKATKALIQKLGLEASDLSNGGIKGISRKVADYPALSKELEIGEITLRDIVKELEKPALDPRDEMPLPVLRSDVLEMKDLKAGMILKGTVRNIIDFGAFVDIGVHQDGLVHISKMTKKYIKHPLEVVSIGDVVEVKVVDVDINKKRIALSLLLEE